MVYFKSLLVGLLALIFSTVITYFLGFLISVAWMQAYHRNGTVFMKLSFKSPILWIVALTVFGASSAWAYHHLAVKVHTVR